MNISLLFLHRLNFLSDCFVSLCSQLRKDLNNFSSERIFMVMDSLSIVLANNISGNYYAFA